MLDRRGMPLPQAGTMQKGFGVAETLKLRGGRLNIRRYAPDPATWPRGRHLRVAFVTDVHAGLPMMSMERVAEIVAATNALSPDLILLGGDYVSSLKLPVRLFAPGDWARELGALRAPLGIWGVLGNHDHKQRPGPGLSPDDGRTVRAVLEAVGIGVLQNEAVRLGGGADAFRLLGLASQRARKLSGRWIGDDDLPGTLAKLSGDGLPTLMVAHEPDIFPAVPPEVALTFSGHTHGGQVRLMNRAYVVPSRYGERYAWGHMVEDGRHLVVSGGVGVSGWPIRIGIPPEIVLVELGNSPEI